MAAGVPIAVKRWGEHRTALIGLVFCFASYLIFAFALTPLILMIGLLVLGLSMLAVPTVQAMLSIDAGEAHQGEIQGASSSLQSLMLVIGPLAMGSLFAIATRPGQAFQFPGAPFMAVAALVALRGLHRPYIASNPAGAESAGH